MSINTDQFKSNLRKSCEEVLSQLQAIDISQFYFQVDHWEFFCDNKTASVIVLSGPIEEVYSDSSNHLSFERVIYSHSGSLVHENIKDDLHFHIESLFKDSLNIHSNIEMLYHCISCILNDFGEDSYANRIKSMIDTTTQKILDRMKMDDVRSILSESFQDFCLNKMKESVKSFYGVLPYEELHRMFDRAMNEVQIETILNS